MLLRSSETHTWLWTNQGQTFYTYCILYLTLQVESTVHGTLKKALATGHWEFESKFGHQDGPGQLSIASDIALCPNGDI